MSSKGPNANPPRVLYSWSLCPSLLLLSYSFAQQPQQQRRLSSIDVERAHVMLRQAYEEVKKNYYDPKYRGIDLDASYHQYDARLNAVQSISESFRIIEAFLATLHDSHTFFMPPSRVSRSATGFHMEMVGDKCFVTRIRPGTDAATRLHVGDQVLTLDGFNVQRAEFSNMLYFFQVLSPEPAEKLDLATPSGERREEIVRTIFRPGKVVLDVSGGGAGGDLWKLVREEEEDVHLNRERIVENSDALIWKMPSFFVAQSTVDSDFSKARKHQTLILDLRGNPGGAIDTLKDMLGHVFDHNVKLADRVSRKDSKPEMVKTRGPVFSGKLIVLVDSKSASAAELFARVIQLEHRGQVIGDSSAGAVMEARHYDESIGADTKIFYGFSITSANLVMTDGKSLEDTGVTPDEIILPTATDLAEGKDPVLSRAAELAGIKLDPVAAGKLFPFEWPSL